MLPIGTILPRWLHERQVVSSLLLLGVVAGTLGVPVAIATRKDISQPFPCMHHRCGCGSAEACWRGCCCLTTAQKMAWAIEHGVSPPEYAIAQADLKEDGELDHPAKAGSCCRHDGSEAATAQTASLSVRLVLTNDFRRCHGLASLWLTMGHALPPKVGLNTPSYRPNAVAWLVETSQSAESLALSIATPPPRHS